MINAIIGSINVKVIDLSGFEMGNNFLKAFRQAINYNPLFLEECTLEGLKNKSNIYSLISCLVLTRNLQYLNLADNNINLKAGVGISQLLRNTRTLEFLNISGC